MVSLTGFHLGRAVRRTAVACFAALLALGMQARAQQDQSGAPEVTHEMAPANTTPTDPATLVTVQGVVRNEATGQPLPRALVQIGGQSGEAALTDNDGRFEISSVPPGPNVFQLTRPGFRDTIPGLDQRLGFTDPAITHAVWVVPGLPELEFAMKPTNVIRGQIELSTGESAQGISVMLLHRTILFGRAVWRPTANTRTNADGVYRFAGLDDGDYSVYTDPSMEGEVPVALVEPGSEANFVRNGFAATYYPDARDFATAGRIHVAGGDTAQANIHLALEPFHLVRAEITRAGGRNSPDADASLNAVLNDAQGHQLPYTAVYDAATHSAQAALPDGTYTLRVSYVGGSPHHMIIAGGGSRGPQPEAGQVDVTVQGRNVTRLRLPLAPEAANAVQVNLTHTSAQTQPIPPNMQRAYILLSQAGGGITDGMVAQFAEGAIPGTLQATPTGPGSYWAHVSTGPGMCESSFTAGGANLAREPLVLNASGASAPLTLTLRDDCAGLRLVMPPNLPRLATGEEPSMTAYIVPDSDSTADVTPVTLRPSSGGSMVAQNLTPGSYHVYTFPAPVSFEYRNRDVLAALPSQQVTLDSGATATLVLEAPAK